MTAPLLVGVLGSRIVSQVAAKIGYGDRELDLYPTSCLEPICAAGMLPVGVASADVGGEPDLCDLITALVVPHDSRGDAGAASDAADHDRHTGLAVVVGALTRRLPVLAIGTGECLIAAALAEHAAEQLAHAGSDGFAASGPDDDGGVDLADRLGASASRRLSMLVPAASVPSGMHAVATGRDGSVYAVASDGGSVGPALSVRWDPASLAPGDQARDGPFRWLRDQAASRRPSTQPGRQEDPTEREEAT